MTPGFLVAGASRFLSPHSGDFLSPHWRSQPVAHLLREFKEHQWILGHTTKERSGGSGRGGGGEYHLLSVLLAHAEILEPRVLPFFFPVSVDQIPQTGEEEKLIHIVNLTASVQRHLVTTTYQNSFLPSSLVHVCIRGSSLQTGIHVQISWLVYFPVGISTLAEHLLCFHRHNINKQQSFFSLP